MLPAYSSAQTVGGLVNPGTVEAAGLLAGGMSVRAVNDRLVADNLTRTQSSQNRRRLATTTTRHLSHLGPDALAHVAQARPGFELLLCSGFRRVLAAQGPHRAEPGGSVGGEP